jgi:hypothetical protein
MPPERALREYEHAVSGNFKHSTTPLQQLDGSVGICLSNLGRQTGGPGLVVSNDAVADRDVHVAEGIMSCCNLACSCCEKAEAKSGWDQRSATSDRHSEYRSFAYLVAGRRTQGGI